MLPVQVDFPKFVPDQLLTSEDLNHFFGYLDEQNRMTRTNLIGIGIVCGLQVKVNNTLTQITITKGCAVTSQGYLISVDTKTYSQYKSYKVDTPKVYDSFYKINGSGDKVPIDIWELKQPGVDPDLKPIEEEFLKDKVVLLFVELKEEENKNCDPSSCDDKGINVTVSFLPMVVGKEDADKLMGTTQGAFGSSTYTSLPEVRMKRWDVPHTRPGASADIFNAYLKILSKDFFTQAESTLKKVYTEFTLLFQNEFPANPFNNLAGKFDFINDGSINTNQLIHIQYYYDLFCDIRDAYQEFRVAGTKLISMCCPDESLFPRHVLLGEAISSVSSGKLPYRHYFIYSPLFDQVNTQAELLTLFRRLVLLVENFHLPAVQINTLKTDKNIRITPSAFGNILLSQKSIPYYYHVNTSPRPLYLSWDYRRTLLNDAHLQLSYNADKYNSGTPDFVTNPLNYDLEPYNFLRVEGIIGKPYTHVLRQVKRQIAINRLPVDIIALTTLEEKLTLKDVLKMNNLSTESHDMLCHFQDLESMYDSIRNELLCTLCKELKYYYDIPFNGLDRLLKINKTANETSQVPLFNACSRGYKIRSGSFGAVIELLYQNGLTDETLNLVNFFQTLGLSVEDANGDNLPDGFSDQISSILLVLLNFFKLPLSIIRLSQLLPEDLTDFDASAYCRANEQMGEYALAIKSIFGVLTGGSPVKAADTGSGEAAADAPAGAAGTPESIKVETKSMRANSIGPLVSAISNQQNGVLKMLLILLMLEDFFDHLDVLIYQCKCSALKSLKLDFLTRYAAIFQLRQFGYFNKMHPGLQHKAGVPMGGTFIIVYHEGERRKSTITKGTEEILSARRRFESHEEVIIVNSATGGSPNNGPAVISGRVADETGEPLAGVSILVVETNQGAITDFDGFFKINVQKTPATLRIQFPGYPLYEEVFATGNDNVRIILGNQPENNLDEIADGTVIADFYLPYRCCSDCPPIQFVINETTQEPPPNIGPKADAGPDLTIVLPRNKAQLNGGASTDPDGSITFYQWAKLSGPGEPSFVTPNSAVTDVNDLEEGIYVFELSVTDDNGDIGRDEMKLTVLPKPPDPNKPPKADAGEDRTIPFVSSTGTSTILDGSQSVDEDGRIVAYEWKQTSGKEASILLPNAKETTVQFFEPDTYIFELTVTDNDGEKDANKVTIIVVRQAQNNPPVAAAGEDQNLILPPTVGSVSTTLNGSASSDPEGGTLSFDWKTSKVPPGSTLPPPSFSNPNEAITQVTGLRLGTYEFTLTVKDNQSQAASDALLVIVSPQQEIVKTCSPLPEIIESFNVFNEEFGPVNNPPFMEQFGQDNYTEVEGLFEDLEQIQNDSFQKHLNFFLVPYHGVPINELLKKWLDLLNKILVNDKELRGLSLRLYNILLQLAMYIVCIQKEDFNKAKVPLDKVFGAVQAHVQSWINLPGAGGFSAGQKKLIEQMGTSIRSEIERTTINKEDAAKKAYLSTMKKIADFLNVLLS